MQMKSTMIYHIVTEKEYFARAGGDAYVPANFAEFGFVHCAPEESVISVANDYYSTVQDTLVALRIDPSRLKAVTKYESPVPETGAGTGHVNTSPVFPHVYGPIEHAAVDGIGVLRKKEAGYQWPEEFISPDEYFRRRMSGSAFNRTPHREYSLRPAVPGDLQTVLLWIESPEMLRRWGGPVPTFPPDVEKTWREIEATGSNTFSLVESAGRIVGFGQLLSRQPGALHLGRIIVSPEMRGRGIGRILCNELLDTGARLFHPSAFTLTVYRDNIPAVTLYTSLGFRVIPGDGEKNACSMSLKV
jgi:[ribosomal protein S18]-alanine N-acetyltransferase